VKLRRRGRILIAGTGVDSTAETISRTEVAAKLGYDYALVAPPYFFKPMMKSDLLVEHFSPRGGRFADSCASVLGAAVHRSRQLRRTSPHAFPSIQYCRMKDSSGNVVALAQSCRSCPPVFNL